MGRYAYVLVADASFVRRIRRFIDKVWRIKALNKAYQKLIADYRKENQAITDVAFLGRLIDLQTKDPFLPKELLPKPWLGVEALKMARSLHPASNLTF